MSSPRSFVDGLVSLDAVETRRRLAAALVEARTKTGGRGGADVAEAIKHVADSDGSRPPIPRRSRPAFRFDVGHHSEMKPATR